MSNNHDYHFPSGELRYPDLTEFEKKNLSREREDWNPVWLALGLLAVLLFLTWIYFQVPTVHAASNDLYEVHQNDYYCRNLGNYVNSGDHKLIDFCAKYLTK